MQDSAQLSPRPSEEQAEGVADVGRDGVGVDDEVGLV